MRLTYPKSDPMNYIAKLLLNSLYGRFGMNDLFTYTEIISNKDYATFEKNSKPSIQDVIDLGKNYLVQLKNPKVDLDTDLDNSFEVHNVSVAIASAVTAYARIHMSQFKNNPLLPNLYYSDTDSVYFDGPLPKEFISNTELGALKLEGIYDKAIFLAPKLYALKNDQETIIKIKGLNSESIKNSNITLESLDLLLTKDSNIQIPQSKWHRHLDEGTIKVLEQLYTLKLTGNKRNLIYDKSGNLINTTPIILPDSDPNKK